jgi:hypothetical protein
MTPSPVPPEANPVIFGTSEYSNLLFGKIQRAASLFGTNLRQPLTIVSEGDSRHELDNCLWHRFCMASCGPSGTLEEEDILHPLSPYIPEGNLTDSLIFVDAASLLVSNNVKKLNQLGRFFASNQKNTRQEMEIDSKLIQPETRKINQELLRVAVKRECAHVYVLSDHSSLSTCISILDKHGVAENVPCTILTIGPNVVLTTTNGWKSTRPQDLKGELTGPVELLPWNPQSRPKTHFSSTTFPAEDAAEVMLQVALRAHRSPTAKRGLLRVVRLQTPDESVGPPRGAPTKKALSSWTSVLSPAFGDVIRSLGKRPDKAQ